MGRSAHRHPHTCAWCGEVTIETTRGFRWWDRVDQRIVPRGGEPGPVLRGALAAGGLEPMHDTWQRLYDERLADGQPRLMRTTTHEIACARRHGGQPVRRV